MRILLVPAIAGCMAMVTASICAAAPPPMNFIAQMNAPQETPPNSSNAFGVAYFTFSETDKMLCVRASYSGLSSAEVASHIHGPALPGVEAAVIFALSTGSPKQQCVGPLDKTQKAQLLKNQLYINVHTANNVNGEIRGQILRIK